MGFVVETGAGLSTATSYVSVAEALAYHADRGNTAWAAGSTAATQVALMRATQAVDAKGLRRFVGTKLLETQALAWPREDGIDAEGYELASDAVPIAVKNATCEGALMELASAGVLQPTLDRGGMVTRERVEGAIDISYANGAPQGTVYTAYLNALSPVLRSGGIAVERV